MKNFLAQLDYTPLAPIPQLTVDKTATGKVTAESFLTNIVPLIIGVAAGLAVIMIVVGGIKYMTTDAMAGKKEARSTIQNAFLGLLLAISSYVVLNTINPKLLDINLRIAPLPRSGPIQGFDPNNLVIPDINSNDPSLVGCEDCTRFPEASGDFPGVNYKPMGSSGCAGPGVCVVDREVGVKLAQLVVELSKSENMANGLYIRFQVIESYPPVREYSETCRQRGKPDSGTCVFAAFTNLPSNPSSSLMANWIRTFMSASRAVGLRSVYEVPTVDRQRQLIPTNGSFNTSNIVVRLGITTERFSIYNSSVEAVSERDEWVAACRDCVPLPDEFSVNAKPPGQGCLAGGPCLVHRDMIPYLRALKSELFGANLSWRITEMYPPTANHTSSCHNKTSNAGKCIDAAIILSGGAPAAVADVKKFMEAIEKARFTSFQYEATTTARQTAIKNALTTNEMKNRVRVNTSATGEHAHINLPGIFDTD